MISQYTLLLNHDNGGRQCQNLRYWWGEGGRSYLVIKKIGGDKKVYRAGEGKGHIQNMTSKWGGVLERRSLINPRDVMDIFIKLDISAGFYFLMLEAVLGGQRVRAKDVILQKL